MHIPKALLLVAAGALALNAPSAFAKDTDEAAKLREAMRQKLSETKGAQSSPAQATPAPAATAAAAQPAPAAQVTPAESAAGIGDDAEAVALREAMRARMTEQPQVTAAPPTAPANAKQKKATAFQPLQAPPSPLAGSKAERLQQLLEQYKADQITPEEYHKQRAKIVAE